MFRFQAEIIFLLCCVVAVTTGQVCIKRLVDGKWISDGACEESLQSIMADIQRLADEEQEQGKQTDHLKTTRPANVGAATSARESTATSSDVVNVDKGVKNDTTISNSYAEASTQGSLDVTSTDPEAATLITTTTIATSTTSIGDDYKTTAAHGDSETVQSCHDVDLVNGAYVMNVTDVGVINVYCDATTDSGNWTVFQRRQDGSVNFDRNWADYVNGFGNINGEFWLGLEAVHQLTKAGNYELRIDMITGDGTNYFAKYSSFKIGPFSDNYRLSANGHSGNTTDSFANPTNSKAFSNGIQFTTRDRDNDKNAGNCAKGHPGGWWYNNCAQAYLNGVYSERKWWFQARVGWLQMRFTELKFRSRAITPSLN